MKFHLILLVLFCSYINSYAQEELSYFLPNDVTYDKNIPTPGEFFNQKIGEWHLTHDQILFYAREIAKLSPRASIKEYARSFENRSLVHVVFTSAENQQNIDKLKELHLKFAEPGQKISAGNVPLVVLLGYGVHGNESSASNSSVLTLYYLAAAQGDKINELLKNTIILIDPCLNPDGLTRHSTWANVHQSKTGITKTDSRQLREVWPGGRTSHYWFDLNRDYLLLTHPETKGRVAAYHEWMPNIVTDHHEMDANSTFFFQPGVKTRNNPLTPEMNYMLTEKIAGFHANFLDNIGADYFSEEQFDDYYIGKGSSYPDINAGVGILFEQAGFRSRNRETANGNRKLAYGIRNQFTVTLSTLEASIRLKDELLAYQKDFFQQSLNNAEKDPVKAYVFGNANDKVKTQLFIELLSRHQIEVYPNQKSISVNGKKFEAETSFIVPTNQKQYRMVKCLFDEVKTFADSAFYDVSTWTMPYAFHIPFAKITSQKEFSPAKSKVGSIALEGKIKGGSNGVGFLFRWNEFTSPKALNLILSKGLTAKVATEKFSILIEGERLDFEPGTILIPANNQPVNKDLIHNLINQVALITGIDFYVANTGITPSGIDLGSGSFARIEKPEILIFAGDGVSSSEAGELWYLFDQLYEIPVCISDVASLGSAKTERYNVMIMPGGSFSNLGITDVQKIKNWVLNGGTLLVNESAGSWASRNDMGKTKYKASPGKDTTMTLNYGLRRKENERHSIAGAIFNTELDLSHPLCYGYSEKYLPVFKSGETVAETLNIKYAEPVNFTSEPLLSGFVSGKNINRIKNAPVVSVQSLGQGKIITYHENMAFRGIWLGTNKLIANGVFFGKIIR